jgi:hypothetical protein
MKRYSPRHAKSLGLLHQLRAVAFSVISHQKQMHVDIPVRQFRNRGDCLVLAFPWMQGTDDDALEK